MLTFKLSIVRVYKEERCSSGVGFSLLLWKKQEGRQSKGRSRGRKGYVGGRFFVYVCILGVSSLLLHGPSHIGTMTDLISHFATVEEDSCGWGFSSRWSRADTQVPAIKRE
jgi:hypothetical protein